MITNNFILNQARRKSHSTQKLCSFRLNFVPFPVYVSRMSFCYSFGKFIFVILFSNKIDLIFNHVFIFDFSFSTLSSLCFTNSFFKYYASLKAITKSVVFVFLGGGNSLNIRHPIRMSTVHTCTKNIHISHCGSVVLSIRGLWRCTAPTSLLPKRFFRAFYSACVCECVCVCLYFSHYFRMANSPHTLKHNKQIEEKKTASTFRTSTAMQLNEWEKGQKQPRKMFCNNS